MTITPQQVDALRDWLAANEAASHHTWITGYTLGRSYIDSRAQGGKNINKRRAYVKIDHATAKVVPEAVGLTAHEIRALVGKEATT